MKYGVTANYVQALQVVLPGGEVIRILAGLAMDDDGASNGRASLIKIPA